MLSVENSGYSKIMYVDVGNLRVAATKASSPLTLHPEETNFCYFEPRDIIDVLEINDVYEPEEESNHRVHVLNKLNALVKGWMEEVSVKRNVNPESVSRCKIYTFGSYRLGVHNKHSDTDVLCVVPRHINRADCFTSFYRLLKSQPEIKELRRIEEAYVPLIRMIFCNVEIDMVFARLELDEISEYPNLRSPRILKNLDPKCIRSLSGYRVTDQILRLVSKNVENFRLVLRAIKLWAKRKGIYSNMVGYLGGVSWAILCAWVCKTYPKADPATLIEKFFNHFSSWDWPRPVILKEFDNVNMGLPAWDPSVNVLDRAHLMPIITPVYPQQNSSFNVSPSSKAVMQKAFADGARVIDNIKKGNATWHDLFEPYNFFGEYVHYVALFAGSLTPEHQLAWTGFIQSKIRHLIGTLETNSSITMAHLHPEPIRPSKLDADEYCSVWFAGLVFIKFGKGEPVNVDLSACIQTFIDTTKRQAEQINLLEGDMTLQAKYFNKKDLHNIVPSFLIKKDSGKQMFG